VDHVAILRKASFGDHILADIIAGRKTIESRWYVNKIAPWDRISQGDTVYFKESGCHVTARAHISKVLQYTNLTPETVAEIITKYGKHIAPNLPEEEFFVWAQNHSNKNYCILVFLEKVARVSPFDIDKKGFGSACAWLVVDDIRKIVLNKPHGRQN